MTRRLSLRSETLTELATTDLASVAGANESGPGMTPPVYFTILGLCAVSHSTCANPSDPQVCQ